MNTLQHIRLASLSTLVAAHLLSVPAANAQTVIYDQGFSPDAGTTNLNGTAPTIGANNWSAAQMFRSDGNINNPAANAGGTATLPFTPANGFTYTLDVSLRGLAAATGATSPENDWIAIGFAKGQGTATGSFNRFTERNIVGKAWMLFRGASTASGSNNAFLGNGTSGISTTIPWTNPALAATYGGDMDLRVVLDTTAGAGSWTATWFAKLPTSTSFTQVAGPSTVLDKDINSVGLSISNQGISGDVTYFRLISQTPGLSAPKEVAYRTVALSSQQAPGVAAGGVFSFFFPPYINKAGQTVFIARLQGTGVVDNGGVWSEGRGSLALVASHGRQAPGIPAGGVFLAIDNPVINDAGQTAILAYLTGGGITFTSGNNTGIWSEGRGSLSLVARTGNAAPGLPTNSVFNSINKPVFNAAGKTAFFGGVTGPTITGSNDAGIWSEGSGSLSLVARENTAAPGITGGVYSRDGFSNPVLNNAGHTAFSTYVSGSNVSNQGIWRK